MFLQEEKGSDDEEDEDEDEKKPVINLENTGSNPLSFRYFEID